MGGLRSRIAATAVFGGLLLLAAPGTTQAASLTIVVNNTGDAADLHPGDGRCDSSTRTGLQCTLRAAIQEANAHAGADTIDFNITSASKTITPAAQLPPVTGTVTIDGYSQPGTSANTKANSDDAVLKVVLDGTNEGSDTSGLDLQASNVVLRGLVIRGFSNIGVLVTGSNVTVRGNFIGTNAAGSAAAQNFIAVEVTGANNTIGGTTPSARNLVSGNFDGIDILGSTATGNVVEGNFVGTDATGKAALPNQSGISISDAPDNTIGGTVSGARNIISGNVGGVGVSGTTGSNLSRIEGNYIGTDSTGNAALGNSDSGVAIDANSVTVGGTTAAARNVISGNGQHGILLFPSGGPQPDSDVIQGNYVGLNAAGTAALGNGLSGITIFDGHNTLIGGSINGAGNVIAGNSDDGILLFSTTSDSTVEGNKIGTKFDGTGFLGNTMNGIEINNSDSNTVGGTGIASNLIEHNNGDGVSILDDSSGNLVTDNNIEENGGQGVDASSGPNTVSKNVLVEDDEGVRVESTATGILISANQIIDSGGLGINLIGGNESNGGVTANDLGDPDTGANDLQNFPVLSKAVHLSNGVTTITGTLNSLPSKTFTVEFFVAIADPSGHGEAELYLGNTMFTTNSSGNHSFSFASAQVLVGELVTTTATENQTGSTSEFSANIQVTSGS